MYLGTMLSYRIDFYYCLHKPCSASAHQTHNKEDLCARLWSVDFDDEGRAEVNVLFCSSLVR